MSLGRNSTRCRSVLSSAVIILISFASPASAAGPFAEFDGSWTGSGSVITTDGVQEAIRCKATYRVKAGGDALGLDVNCASASYRVDIVSEIIARDGALSGSWQEKTREIQGDVTGRIPSADVLQASLQTAGGGIQLGARTNGKQQAIAITSQGTEIRSVNITLRKR